MQGALFARLYLLQVCSLGILVHSTDLSLFDRLDHSFFICYSRVKLRSSKTISVILSVDSLLLRLMLEQV